VNADCLHHCLPGVPDQWNTLLYNVMEEKLTDDLWPPPAPITTAQGQGQGQAAVEAA
jgi:hypothetical protein